jgi:hypothetical protein
MNHFIECSFKSSRAAHTGTKSAAFSEPTKQNCWQLGVFLDIYRIKKISSRVQSLQVNLQAWLSILMYEDMWLRVWSWDQHDTKEQKLFFWPAVTVILAYWGTYLLLNQEISQ